jgi:hypothetical protein
MRNGDLVRGGGGGERVFGIAVNVAYRAFLAALMDWQEAA